MYLLICIIDYRAGNLTSVQRALQSIGYKSVITSDRDTIAKASRIIFPGVGAAGSAMESLKEKYEQRIAELEAKIAKQNSPDEEALMVLLETIRG